MPINVRLSLGATTSLSCVTVSFSYASPVFAEQPNTPESKYVHAFIDQWRAAILNPASGTSMATRVAACNWAATDGCVNISCICTGNPTSVRGVAALMFRALKPLSTRNKPADATDPGLAGVLKNVAILVTGKDITKAKTLQLQRAKSQALQAKLGAIKLPKWIVEATTEPFPAKVAPLAELKAVKIPASLTSFWIYMFVVQRDGSTEVSQEWLVRESTRKLGYSKYVLEKRAASFLKKLGKKGLEFRAASLGRLSPFSKYFNGEISDLEYIRRASSATDSLSGVIP